MKINNTACVAILMATYNGEKYLAEQLDSIISQEFEDWNLFIQDDGSHDATLEIINAYCRKDKRIHLVDTGLSKQGATMNFLSLLNIVESKYYMFCDQDDVWFPTKIQLEYDKMKEIERDGIPVLIGTDKTRVDEIMNILLQSEYIRYGETPQEIKQVLAERSRIEMLRCLCPIAGCTMFFNYAAKIVSFPFINLRYHDSIVSIAVAHNNGIIDFVLYPTMYYRLHNHNTCGVSETSRSSKLFKIKQNLDGLIQMYRLYKIYGGQGLFSFIHCRWRLFRTFRTINLYHK